MAGNQKEGLVFSGVQPTGNLHLGNYLGAIRQWVRMQDSHHCIYCIVDLHAITVFQNPEALRESILTTAATYIACGVDPKRSIIFNQSAVPGHSELAWILGCHTPLGWLNRMTQFKEKAGKHRENAVLGLYSYPVLMAADILLYKATHVPVGEDQKQHLELARDIAGAFNRAYNQDVFPLPEPLILGGATRVMSLRDGSKKMSKSDESDFSRIHLTDDADTIRRKIMKAKADMEFDGIYYDAEKRPEISNLLTILAALQDVSVEEAQKPFANAGNKEFKEALADVAVSTLSPISTEIQRLIRDERTYLMSILEEGADKSRKLSEVTLQEVHQLVGFLA
ncbi:MAG: tryptophan--tRNA ligase [Hyphomicrobiales bacterium]|nr:tryptophan--tRNA ligase [Hyphomicrobiales bacterium]